MAWRGRQKKREEYLIAQLYQQIGQLKVEQVFYTPDMLHAFGAFQREAEGCYGVTLETGIAMLRLARF